jgi:hypothetical protein
MKNIYVSDLCTNRMGTLMYVCINHQSVMTLALNHRPKEIGALVTSISITKNITNETIILHLEVVITQSRVEQKVVFQIIIEWNLFDFFCR